MRYLFWMVFIFSLWSCDCEEEFACRDKGQLVGSEELLDNVFLQVSNVLFDEEVNFVVAHTFPLDSFDLTRIESFEFQIVFSNGFSFTTSEPSYISENGRYISILREDMNVNSDFIEGYAFYSLRLFLEEREGFIGIEDGEILLVTCERFASGVVVVKDCRVTSQIFPSNGFGDHPIPICQ